MINSATLINLTYGSSYYIYIVAYNGSIHSINSSMIGPILIPLLATPTITDAVSTSFTEITVSWSWSSLPTPTQTVTGYNIYYSTSQTQPTTPKYIVMTTSQSGSQVITDLTNNTSYYIWVQAFNNTYTSLSANLNYKLQYNGVWYMSNGVLTSGLPISAPAIYVASSNIITTTQPSAAWSINNGILTANLPIFVNSVNTNSSAQGSSYTNYWYDCSFNTISGLYTSYPIAITSFTPS